MWSALFPHYAADIDDDIDASRTKAPIATAHCNGPGPTSSDILSILRMGSIAVAQTQYTHS